MTIIIILLLSLCIGLIIALSRKVQIDNKTKNLNEQLSQENKRLQSEKQELLVDKEVIRKEIITNERERSKLNNDLNNLRNNISNTLNQNKEICDNAFKEYQNTLDNAYNDAEEQFDTKLDNLNKELGKVQNELDALKMTRAAAHEALLKEQEIKDNKDNYRLIPSQSDLADVRRLEIVKRELNKPRILSMLIWQTYWQPIAKKQFPNIIQAKTKCGIYKITNLTTDECYIGQAVDIYKRWNEHCKCGLGIDTPPGNKLYKAIQEYGLDNFTFEVLTECKQSELNEKEKYFIELYQANLFGYNGTGGNK